MVSQGLFIAYISVENLNLSIIALGVQCHTKEKVIWKGMFRAFVYLIPCHIWLFREYRDLEAIFILRMVNISPPSKHDIFTFLRINQIT